MNSNAFGVVVFPSRPLVAGARNAFEENYVGEEGRYRLSFDSTDGVDAGSFFIRIIGACRAEHLEVR